MNMVALAGTTFVPGSVHIATVVFNNTKDVAIDYTAELRLVDIYGATQATSGLISFSIAAKGSENVPFSITVPSVSGSYTVWVDVYIDGILNVQFVSATLVTIATPGPVFTYSNEQGGHVSKGTAYSWVKFECDITNPTGTTVTETIMLWAESPYAGPWSRAHLLACNSGYGACPDCKDPGQIELTLAPGQSYHYRFCGWNCSTMYTSSQYLWLVDDRGGESAHRHC